VEDILKAGRRIWVMVHGEGLPNFVVGPFIITKFKQFLPAGRYNRPDGVLSERKKSLVQVWTDPGGMRTLAVADVRLKDPGRTLS
jgi:hypothetical protein